MAGLAESDWPVCVHEFTHFASTFSIAYTEIFLLDSLQGITATFFLFFPRSPDFTH